jgi:hypothetical protein
MSPAPPAKVPPKSRRNDYCHSLRNRTSNQLAPLPCAPNHARARAASESVLWITSAPRCLGFSSASSQVFCCATRDNESRHATLYDIQEKRLLWPDGHAPARGNGEACWVCGLGHQQQEAGSPCARVRWSGAPRLRGRFFSLHAFRARAGLLPCGWCISWAA